MNEMDTRFANQFNIQWFPGHMTKTLRMMEQEIQHVDASLVLLDARIPLSSLNPEIERITARKPKLYALNKADLADPAVTEEWIKYFRAADAGCVAISAKQKGGANAVKAAIEKELAGLLEQVMSRASVTLYCDDLFAHEEALVRRIKGLFRNAIYLYHSEMSSCEAISAQFGKIAVIHPVYSQDRDRRLRNNRLIDKMLGTDRVDHYTTPAPVYEALFRPEEINRLVEGSCLVKTREDAFMTEINGGAP